MKSINVIDQYTDYIKKSLTKIAKLVLKKNYSEEDFSKLLDTYTKARYYDSLARKSKSPYFNTRTYIKEGIGKLEDSTGPVSKIYHELLVSDQNNVPVKEILKNIEKYRNELKINDPETDKQVIELYDEIAKKKKEIERKYRSKDFTNNYKSTNIRKVYDVVLEYSFNIPKLYSEFAIDKVYNTGTINEDKLYVEYYLVTSRVLREVINYDFSNNYIVEFASTLLEKDSKLVKMLDLISDDLCKEKISLKIDFSSFMKHKDKILDLINKGYNFALIIDDTYEEKADIKKIITSVFKYIIIARSDENLELFKECSNVIRTR